MRTSIGRASSRWLTAPSTLLLTLSQGCAHEAVMNGKLLKMLDSELSVEAQVR